MVKGDIYSKAFKVTLKRLMHNREPYKSISTYSLSQDHVHYKTNTSKSSKVNMHINIIENITKTTLSSSYNINKHEEDYILT